LLIVTDTLSVGTSELTSWVAATFGDVVESEVLEATLFVTFIRLISTLWFTITSIFKLDTVSVGTLELRSLAAASLVVVEREFSEAAMSITFIRLISALGFSVTEHGVVDTVTILAGPFSLWITSTSIDIIELEVLEAALLVSFIRLIWALGSTITEVGLRDTISRVTLPFAGLAATFLVVVESEFLEAALSVTFIRSIGALSFSITVLTVLDAFSVGACEFSVWIAATDLRVVEIVILEAALLLTFIRSIRALVTSITNSLEFDASTISTGPFILEASTSLVVVEGVVLEAA
jgi:hypothetical protein